MMKIKITVDNQEVEGELTRRTRRAIIVKKIYAVSKSHCRQVTLSYGATEGVPIRS